MANTKPEYYLYSGGHRYMHSIACGECQKPAEPDSDSYRAVKEAMSKAWIYAGKSTARTLNELYALLLYETQQKISFPHFKNALLKYENTLAKNVTPFDIHNLDDELIVILKKAS